MQALRIMKIINKLICATTAMGSVAISSGNITTAAVAAVSAGAAITGRMLHQKKYRLEKHRDKISNKLNLVLIPLKGNLTQYQQSIEAMEATKKCSILEHVRNVCEKQDGEALENWRGYYYKSLAPLNLESQKIIKAHSHLVKDDGLSDIFKTFLTTSETHKIAMEYWMDHQNERDSINQFNSEDFKVEHNCCTFHGYDEMYSQIKEVEKKLDAKLKAINETLNRNAGLTSLFNIK